MVKDKKDEASSEPMQIEVVKEKIQGMQEMVSSTTVDNEDELDAVADVIKQVKTLGKIVRVEMERFTKPAQDIINNAREKYLPFEKECKEAEATLKKKASIFMDAKEAQRKKDEDRVADKLDRGTIKEDTAINQMEKVGTEKKTVSTGSSQMTAKKVRKYRIIDKDKIPHPEYWMLDEAKIKKVALAGVAIPGVEVYEETEMAVR